MIMVYHSKNPRTTMSYGDSDECKAIILDQLDNHDAYEHVADVDSNNMDRAYQLTNHINQSWTLNDDVEAIKEKVRSTSVGDLLFTEDGIYVVATFGFDLVRKLDK